MSAFIKQLRQAATKISEMAGMDSQATQQHGDIDPLDASRARLDGLRTSMAGMKTMLLTHSRHVLTFSASSAEVAQEWAALYAHSNARVNSLQSFTVNQTRIDEVGLKLYKENYGWDVLKVFDDWEVESTKTLQDIEKTEKLRTHVSGLDSKVRSLRASKEKRMKRNEPLTSKEEAELEAAEQMLDKYSVGLSNMRVSLEKNLTIFFDARFSTLDKAFVRFMELQIEFFRESQAASQNYQSIIDNYRKRFPRQTQQYPVPEAHSPLPAEMAASSSNNTQVQQGRTSSNASANGEINLLDLPNENGSGQHPARARSTPPQSADPANPTRTPTDKSAQQQQQQQRTAPAGGVKKSPSPPIRQGDSSDDSSSSDSGSDSDTDTDEETPRNKPNTTKQQSRSAPVAAAAEPIDIFNFPPSASTQQKSTPTNNNQSDSAASSKSQPKKDNAVDFDFFGATAPPAKSSSSSTAAKTPTTKPNAPPSASSSSNVSEFSLFHPSPIHSSASTPILSKPSASSQVDEVEHDPFDPIQPSSTKKSNNKNASSSSSSASGAPKRSSSPPPAAPGTTTSGMNIAYIPPTHELDDHIAAQQDAKVAALRDADARTESMMEERREAELRLEPQLAAWETNKDGNKKNIRNLLSSVHTVLWPNSGWKPVSFADLIDFNAIKKAHMKVIRVVHPDRLVNPTAEQSVIALRVFDVLNTAFDNFRNTGL